MVLWTYASLARWLGAREPRRGTWTVYAPAPKNTVVVLTERGERLDWPLDPQLVRELRVRSD